MRLRLAREERKMTQAELARRVSRLGSPMHASTVYKIESGGRKATIGEASTIADALDADLRDLAGGSEVADQAARNVRVASFALISVMRDVHQYSTHLEKLRSELQRLLEEVVMEPPLATSGARWDPRLNELLTIEIEPLDTWRRSVETNAPVRALLVESGLQPEGATNG
jgi:transcriptional regulator with XRE-family HTH domain